MPRQPTVLTDAEILAQPCTAPGCNATSGQACRVTEIAGKIGEPMTGFHFARINGAGEVLGMNS